MKKITFATRTAQLLIAALLPLSFSHSKELSDISQLSAGAPTNLGTKLGPNGYIPVETQKLTHAKVVWVNWDYLRKAGFNVGNIR